MGENTLQIGITGTVANQVPQHIFLLGLAGSFLFFLFLVFVSFPALSPREKICMGVGEHMIDIDS